MSFPWLMNMGWAAGDAVQSATRWTSAALRVMLFGKSEGFVVSLKNRSDASGATIIARSEASLAMLFARSTTSGERLFARSDAGTIKLIPGE